MGLASLWQVWQRRREDAALRRRAIPDDLWKRTLVRFPFLRWRSAEEQAELRRLTSLFLDRKEFSAAGDLRMSDAIVVSIAAQAVLPVLKLGLARYDGFVGIVVHPDQVVARRNVQGDDGLVHEYDETLAGEAVRGGPVMLSWRDVREAGRPGAAGYNVVVHEFAHVLDLADGLSDGVPLLPAGLSRATWLAVLQPQFEAFVARCEAGETGETAEETALDPYAASGIDEFFAVASESFFVDPHGLVAEHAPLYELLARFYEQDPRAYAPAPPPAR
ncbi:MAG: zinc-dependent peptidase [Betaproteobacteria bacterium]|nr:zinc-dependent peptidase [Betaproteobacteria bacterium]MCC6248568.1 zinc-dependent peptidase [Rubrivivax sp.]MCL4699987.1 zinc-dependent peptidase [Burkholderiaceae bacterium]